MFMNNIFGEGFDRKDVVIGFGGMFLQALVNQGVSEVFQAKSDHDKRAWKELHIYDKEFDVVYTLKRPMTNKEKVKYSKEAKEGKLAIGEILYEMGILSEE